MRITSLPIDVVSLSVVVSEELLVMDDELVDDELVDVPVCVPVEVEVWVCVPVDVEVPVWVPVEVEVPV